MYSIHAMNYGAVSDVFDTRNKLRGRKWYSMHLMNDKAVSDVFETRYKL